MNLIKFIAVIAVAVSASASVAHEAHEHPPAKAPEAAAPAEQTRIGDAWPLATCVVSGQPLGSMGDPIIKLHEGREVRFCCEGCVAPFEKEPAKYLERADKTITEQQKASYPLDYCIVDTAEKLSEDESKNSYHVIGNRLFIFCCPPCEEDVRAEPAKFFKLLDDAVIAKQSVDYPLTTCLVSGEELGSMGEPINHVHGGNLYKFCCPPCAKNFEATPAKFTEKLEEARKQKQTPKSETE